MSSPLEIIEKESDEFFLDLIAQRPCLFNKSVPEYHDKIIRENAMEEIAFNMQDTVENCEKKWKHFVSCYQREMSLQNQEKRSGSGASVRKPWIHFERMKSLFSHDMYRNVYSNLGETKQNFQFKPPKKTIKKKGEDLMISAFNNVQSQLTTLLNTATVSDTKEIKEDTYNKENCNVLIGKLIHTRLNELDFRTAKRKRKLIMKALIEEDSEDSSI